jgi:hypothetical protein
MDFDLLQKRRAGKIMPRKIPLSRQVKKSISMLIFALLFLIIILSIVYLSNKTQSSQQGYVLKQEQLIKESLLLEKRQLINKINEAKSFQTIDESSLLEEMVEAPEPTYIKANTGN